MGLVGRVGRKRWRARIAMAVVYFILSLGALTTLYPFAIMVSTGFKGPTDQNDPSLIPPYWSNLANDEEPGRLDPKSLLGKYLADKYAGDQSQIASTRGGPTETKDYEQFLMELPLDHWAAGFRTAPNQVTGRLSLRYQSWLRAKYRTIDDLNRAYIEEHTAFQTVQPPAELLERANWQAADTPKYREWLEFKATLPAEFRLPVRGQRMWQEYLRAKFENQFDRVPAEFVGQATRFEAVPLPNDFSTGLPLAFRQTVPKRYQGKFVEDHWGGPMPIEAYEGDFVARQAETLRREFTTRNYRYVLDYIALNGRALWNTALFCILAILTQLTVNPLAAYALSRYPIRASGKILLFLLATMAFPAEVAMIPSFLLLKDLGLLNTFAALVLPTAASGYMIYLLKGFFDSLPPELFESGQIDGAKESTMMFRIAMPLSKPVLGYLALMAFMGAYGAFLYAFLVAQDQRVWTLMVFIYQLQNTAPKAVMMAALTLAAIPTLFVFLIAQRAILRGIILPGEK
ncbi:MAG: ABC transporter permease subunit [Methanoregulaceae archaeon]|nr:ABC transporter permease subunit [Methanoregulaceae archaeon]